ncbi:MULTISPECIES: hypothetical protein [unclassified Sphingomonas]|uniref:hypothetical protein n=1 Tax=unclassified Sphingomonas TaxID=196159 RepID=UPI00226A5382|nr:MULTISPECIES: hypothetical protein [unclassified Sphingomonas]
MSYQLGSPKPVTKELIPASGDRPAVTITLNAQPSPLSLRAARRAVLEEYQKGGIDAQERAGDAFSAAILRHNILSWSGIGDENDQPVEPTPDVEQRDDDGNVVAIEPGTISSFLAEPRLVERADEEYVIPWAKLDAEKNGLSLSPPGTSAGATQGDGTATSSVKPESTDDAGTTTAAPPVNTKSTKPKRTKAKPSGG